MRERREIDCGGPWAKKKDVPVSGVRRNLADFLKFPHPILNISACRCGKARTYAINPLAKSLVDRSMLHFGK